MVNEWSRKRKGKEYVAVTAVAPAIEPQTTCSKEFFLPSFGIMTWEKANEAKKATKWRRSCHLFILFVGHELDGRIREYSNDTRFITFPKLCKSLERKVSPQNESEWERKGSNLLARDFRQD